MRLVCFVVPFLWEHERPGPLAGPKAGAPNSSHMAQ